MHSGGKADQAKRSDGLYSDPVATARVPVIGASAACAGLACRPHPPNRVCGRLRCLRQRKMMKPTTGSLNSHQLCATVAGSKVKQSLIEFALIGTLVASGAAFAGPVSGQGTWENTLKARDTNGHSVALDAVEAAYFYDSTLDVTWLANWNAAAGSVFDNGSIASDGRMTWDSAMAWAGSLTQFGGGWRLPKMLDPDPTCNPNYFPGAYDCTGSEMGRLFYLELGNTRNPLNPPNTGPFAGFSNTIYDQYWYGTEVAWYPQNTSAWMMNLYTGFQDYGVGKAGELKAVAVRGGDVLVVPEPSTLVLVTAVLFTVVTTRRRRPHGLALAANSNLKVRTLCRCALVPVPQCGR